MTWQVQLYLAFAGGFLLGAILVWIAMIVIVARMEREEKVRQR